ncbi:MAG: hypothetical protein WBI01_08890, partial [Syntrophomonadaceae bacterium]
GRMADEFTEGSVLRQVGQSIPLVGGVAGPILAAQMLSDRSEQPKAKRGISLPAEPVETEEQPRVHRNGPRRMGTFTPEEEIAAPAVIRPPATGDDVQQRVSAVGADVRAQAGQAKADRERSDYADDMHGEEVEDRIAALGVTLQAQPITGVMRVEGAANIAGIMGDFISQMRVQRTLDGLPLAGGADHFTVAQGVARAMGVTPREGDRAPLQGDVSRVGLFADRALRLGLTGQQVQTVISEVKNSPTGQLTPQTQAVLVEQARGTLNTGWEGAQQAVSALQRAAVMLPNALTARGTVAVPHVNVTPQIQVNVSAPEHNSLDTAMQSQAVLAGSQVAAKGSGA